MSDFIKSLGLAASGLNAQAARMRIIAENLANADSTGATPGQDPYRRRIPTFDSVFSQALEGREVKVGKIAYDMTAFESRYEPGHPAADANGYVLYPNVDPLIEAMDMREAQRTYEANLNVVSSTRQMIGQTIDILRR
jgi:flagellar basal-body rod protein FlgC